MSSLLAFVAVVLVFVRWSTSSCRHTKLKRREKTAEDNANRKAKKGEKTRPTRDVFLAVYELRIGGGARAVSELLVLRASENRRRRLRRRQRRRADRGADVTTHGAVAAAADCSVTPTYSFVGDSCVTGLAAKGSLMRMALYGLSTPVMTVLSSRSPVPP